MAAAISVIAYPELIKRGYPKWMAACSVDASGCSRGVVWGCLLRLKQVLLRPALSLGIDPIHLGILTALAIEIGSVIPPVGLNLFAVSGVTGLPVTQVIRGSFPFCCSDTVVLIIVLLFLTLALWPPTLLQTSYF